MVAPTRRVRIKFYESNVPGSSSPSLSSSTASHINTQVSNRITTAKYGYSTFFPKFFYEQFRKYSNIFFTFIALFQQIPNVSPTGRYTTLVPLICILGVSAIKELFEDFKRHKADRKVNESEILVLNKTTLEWDLKRWQDVRVGDIVKCVSENFFPSDLLLLCSSELNGMCYIETANLDGETNLKIRQSLPCTAVCAPVNQLEAALNSAVIECDPPNARLYEFEGRLIMPNGIDSFPLGPENILLRGAKLKNTVWIYGAVLYTGHESKLMMNSLAKTPIKQSRLEKITNVQILWLVFILLTTGFLSAVFSQIWTSGNNHWYIFGDTPEPFKFGMTYLTFVILYNNLVPISLQVSLEVVRTFQAHFINSDLEMYDKNTDTFAMARTSNLNEELGQVRYILSDKTGTLTMNVMKFKKCSVNGQMYDDSTFNLLAETAQNEIPSDYQTAINNNNPQSLVATSSNDTQSPRRATLTHHELVGEFLTLLAVCHTVVPEQESDAHKRNIDKENRPLGAGDNVATPKLPKKKAMHQRRADETHVTAMKTFKQTVSSRMDDCEVSTIDNSDETFLNDKTNDIILSSSPNSSNASTSSIVYHAASPDEAALVRGAQQVGYEFCGRTPHSVQVNKFGSVENFEILHVFEFDSFRKRMSVVVKTQDGKIKIYTKGADTVIFQRLADDSLVQVTSKHLDKFAHEGFRTLCCAYAYIDTDKYKEWLPRYNKASLLFGEAKVRQTEACIDELERDLTLVGATAIEDRLQDDVPETIDTLLKAGINFWLLTGDKQETAINIGFSCKLLSKTMPLILINEDSLDATRDIILRTSSTPDSALVIDGRSLDYALTPDLKMDFMKIALECKSVICCRVSPFQKAEMVQLVKDLTGEVTLAIGDGANDVAMIRTANIGVGISGSEGLQAAHSADYTISQFRFLARLLLVHGSWSMTRLRQMILYSFYKNIALYIVEFWFAIVSGWSGQTIFERWTIGLYNVIFTAAPPFALGVFDRKCSAETMLKHPELYKANIGNESYTTRSFWMWIATAFWHSLLLFWFTYLIIYHDALWQDGKSDGGYLVFGNILYTYVVVTVCLKAGLEMNSWTM
jgi:magnesium-transporting ATPase (P-type)